MKRNTFEKANAATWDELDRIVGEIEKRTHFRIDPDPLARTGRRVYARHDRICTVA